MSAVRRLGLRDDRGLATVVAAGVIGIVGLLLGAVLVLGSAVATRHRAENAADLAALAGSADAARGREPACATAREVAERNGATLVRCTWIGWGFAGRRGPDLRMSAHRGPDHGACPGRSCGEGHASNR